MQNTEQLIDKNFYRKMMADIIEFQYIVPIRYSENLEILILISQGLHSKIRGEYYNELNLSPLDILNEKLLTFNYSIDLGLSEFDYRICFVKKNNS